ncbi:MAG TPA: type II toxin-antitoxin system RelE/ParE family toxin [Pseudolysinimonas sp.]|nr:type II toxin-antitoxin system RelE/ParE family toxin [Pseudolysinimonas sp.]
MSWDVQLAPAAVRGLERLPPRIAAAVVEFVTATLPTNPERMSKPLRGDLDGLRSARRGDYRVLFSLDEAMGTLIVERIAHRADVYRPR